MNDLISNFSEINQIKSLNQQLLRSKKNFKKGDVLCSFSESKIGFEITYLTVQISEFEHITLKPTYLQYINHSCDPNAFFDVDAMNLIAVKDIKEQEELTFFYPSTEWSMVQPFDCFCKSDTCLHRIEGASKIQITTLKEYKLSSFISKKSGFCPCGSTYLFSDCCEPIIKGGSKAETAEQLMRSRYTAYTICDVEYLLKTTHSSIRNKQSFKDIEEWSKENTWHKLEILNSTENTVEFKVYFLDCNKSPQIHQEKSTFIFENEHWFYSLGEFDF